MLGDVERRSSEDWDHAELSGRVLLRWPQEWQGMSAGGWLVAAVLLMGLAVLMASAGMALIALIAAGVGAGRWLSRRLRSADRRRPRR